MLEQRPTSTEGQKGFDHFWFDLSFDGMVGAAVLTLAAVVKCRTLKARLVGGLVGGMITAGLAYTSAKISEGAMQQGHMDVEYANPILNGLNRVTEAFPLAPRPYTPRDEEICQTV